MRAQNDEGARGWQCRRGAVEARLLAGGRCCGSGSRLDPFTAVGCLDLGPADLALRRIRGCSRRWAAALVHHAAHAVAEEIGRVASSSRQCQEQGREERHEPSPQRQHLVRSHTPRSATNLGVQPNFRQGTVGIPGSVHAALQPRPRDHQELDLRCLVQAARGSIRPGSLSGSTISTQTRGHTRTWTCRRLVLQRATENGVRLAGSTPVDSDDAGGASRASWSRAISAEPSHASLALRPYG